MAVFDRRGLLDEAKTKPRALYLRVVETKTKAVLLSGWTDHVPDEGDELALDGRTRKTTSRIFDDRGGVLRVIVGVS